MASLEDIAIGPLKVFRPQLRQLEELTREVTGSETAGNQAVAKEWRDFWSTVTNRRDKVDYPEGIGTAGKIGLAPFGLGALYAKDALDFLGMASEQMFAEKKDPQKMTMLALGLIGGHGEGLGSGIRFGKLPKKGLVAAIQDDLGNLYVGSKGDFHSSVVEKFNISFNDFSYAGEGFVDEAGNFLTRKEAKKRLSPTMQDSLDVRGYDTHAADLEVDKLFRKREAEVEGLNKKLLADQFGVEYQGEGLGLLHFFDPETKGNITVKSLDDLEKRVLQLRKDFKETVTPRMSKSRLDKLYEEF